jgi:hypothetical protein
MMEFFAGFLIGVISVVLSGIAYYIVKDPDFKATDYNMIEKSLEDYVDSSFDSENYFKKFKREGTK